MTMRATQVPAALDRLSDRADYAIIGPHDGRVRVLNTRQFPYRAVCHVERDFGDGRLAGCSGFLVRPNVVVTAGHCVYSHRRQRRGGRSTPLRIRITPGKQGDAAAPPFGRLWAVRWYAHPTFISASRAAYDYGVIVLPRGFPRLGGVFRPRAASDQALRAIRTSRLLHISGYPSDKPRGTQWTHWERLDRFGPLTLSYSVDTCPGHSGAPIWVKTGPAGSPQVIGIHTRGPRPHPRGPWGCRPGAPVAPAGMANGGVRLTTRVLRDVQAAAAGSSLGGLRRLK